MVVAGRRSNLGREGRGRTHYVSGNSCLISTNSKLVLPHAPSPNTSTLRDILPEDEGPASSPSRPQNVIVMVGVVCFGDLVYRGAAEVPSG